MSSPLLTVSEIHTYYGDSYVLQGVSLTAAAVEGKHELAAKALAVRMARHLGLDLADELGVAAEAQIRLDALLEPGEPLLLQARDLGLREPLVGHVGQRWAAP